MGYIEEKGESKSRTIRIDEAFDDELMKEAENQSISVSKLVENIIEGYLNQTRWVEKRRSLTIIPATLQAFMEELDDDTIAEIGSKLGSVTPKEGFMVRGLPMNEDSARLMIEKILGESAHWFSASYHHHSRPYFYVMSHFDGKWIVFIEAYLKAFYRTNFGKDIECQRVGDNLQVLI